MAFASGSDALSRNSDSICFVGDSTYFVNTPTENKSVDGILLACALFFASFPLVDSGRPSKRVATCLFARIRPFTFSQAVLHPRVLPHCCLSLIFAVMFPYFSDYSHPRSSSHCRSRYHAPTRARVRTLYLSLSLSLFPLRFLSILLVFTFTVDSSLSIHGHGAISLFVDTSFV